VRTFALAGVAGCLAALWGTPALAAVAAGTGLIAAVAYARRAEADSGPVTEVALVLTVLLGGTAVTSPALAAGAGVATAVILVSKERLHRFVRQGITDLEVTDALKFFVVALIILPVIPHARLGPYGAIDPRRIWTLVVAVTGLSWLGYLAVRILGPGRGMPIAGLAGGFVSERPRRERWPGTRVLVVFRRAGLAGALMASVATMIQLVVITAIADVRVARLLAPAAATGSLILALEAGLLSLRRKRSSAIHPSTAPSSDPSLPAVASASLSSPGMAAPTPALSGVGSPSGAGVATASVLFAGRGDSVPFLAGHGDRFRISKWRPRPLRQVARDPFAKWRRDPFAKWRRGARFCRAAAAAGPPVRPGACAGPGHGPLCPPRRGALRTRQARRGGHARHDLGGRACRRACWVADGGDAGGGRRVGRRQVLPSPP
jgi:uncharacterized membrane protein (DUF4010 family)